MAKLLARKNKLLSIALLSMVLAPQSVFAWGELGHRIIAENGTKLAGSDALTKCRVTGEEMVSHTNDPDKIWRNKRRDFPKEAQAHFFHVDRQPKDWKKRKDPAALEDGFLVYRMTAWIKEARELRKKNDWDELKKRLYGLSHYAGDLSQPLHLHHDYDGEQAGMPGLHSQYETKMLNRFEDEIRSDVRQRLEEEKIPALWPSLAINDLIYGIAEQSNAKTAVLFNSAQQAFSRVSTKKKKTSLRFSKPVLFSKTRALTADQLALSARLWAHILNQVCSF